MGAARIPKDRCPVPIERFIRMEANLCSRQEKLKELFGITDWKNDPRTKSADDKMVRWRKHPMYKQIWNDEISKQDYDDYAASRKRFRELMKSQDGYLAVQAAIQVANNSSKRLFRDEENTVHITFDGMPEIGTPDGEES